MKGTTVSTFLVGQLVSLMQGCQMDKITETMGYTLAYSFLGILEYVFSYFVMIDNSLVNDFIMYPFAFIVLFL